MAKKKKYVESQLVREIAYIMKVHPGPFTKKFLAEELVELHPDIDLRTLMLEISIAINLDKDCNSRFKVVKQGWWDLAGRG